MLYNRVPRSCILKATGSKPSHKVGFDLDLADLKVLDNVNTDRSFGLGDDIFDTKCDHCCIDELSLFELASNDKLGIPEYSEIIRVYVLEKLKLLYFE